MKNLTFVFTFLFVFSASCFSQGTKLSERIILDDQKVVLTIDVDKELIVLTNEDSLCLNDNYKFVYAEIDIYMKEKQGGELVYEYVGTIELESFDFPIVEFEVNECINFIRLEIENKKTEELSLFMNLSVDLDLLTKK